MTFIFTYILNFCLYGVIGAALYFLFRLIYLKALHKKRKSTSKEMLGALFAFYFAGLLSQTVLPNIGFSFGDGLIIDVFFNWKNYIRISKEGFEHIQNEPIQGSINLIPFKTIASYFTGEDIRHFSLSDLSNFRIVNVLGNVLLFVPFGLLLPVINKRTAKFSRVLLWSSLLVLLIEFEQYFIGRSADIDDFILNVFGALCGYLLYKIVRKILHKKTSVSSDKQKGDLI